MEDNKKTDYSSTGQYRHFFECVERTYEAALTLSTQLQQLESTGAHLKSMESLKNICSLGLYAMTMEYYQLPAEIRDQEVASDLVRKVNLFVGRPKMFIS